MRAWVCVALCALAAGRAAATQMPVVGILTTPSGASDCETLTAAGHGAAAEDSGLSCFAAFCKSKEWTMSEY